MIEKETLDPTEQRNATPGGDPALIASRWPQLVAAGHQGYRRDGRGVVVIRADDGYDSTRATYVSQASLAERDDRIGGPWPTEEIRHRMQTYNPEAEIVVLVMREDGQVHCYRVIGITQPQDATVSEMN